MQLCPKHQSPLHLAGTGTHEMKLSHRTYMWSEIQQRPRANGISPPPPRPADPKRPSDKIGRSEKGDGGWPEARGQSQTRRRQKSRRQRQTQAGAWGALSVKRGTLRLGWVTISGPRDGAPCQALHSASTCPSPPARSLPLKKINKILQKKRADTLCLEEPHGRCTRGRGVSAAPAPPPHASPCIQGAGERAGTEQASPGGQSSLSWGLGA